MRRIAVVLIFCLVNQATLAQAVTFNPQPVGPMMAMPRAETTRYIGSLYEEKNPGTPQAERIQHIYLGDRKIASVINGQVQYYRTDHLGNVTDVVDAQGNVLEHFEYDPFGQITRHNIYPPATQTKTEYRYNGKPQDERTGLYYYGARYYNPVLGKFITPDSVLPDPKNPQAFNRYSYVYNNPIKYNDPSGNFPWLAAIIGAVIGGASGGIASHQNHQPIWQGILFGGMQGFFSGAALGTPFSSIKEQGYFWGLARASGGFSLAGQIAGATGGDNIAKTFNYAAMGTGALYAGVNIAKGIKDWVYENRFNTYDTIFDEAVYVQSGDKVHVNGIVTDLDGALREARSAPFNANILANNPTSGPIADLTESLLQKVTFTSSVDRQLGSALTGLSEIQLSGFSQGGIIATNTMLNLGLRDQRNVVSHLNVASSQVSQIRVFASGAMGAGLSRGQITYGAGSMWDFSNFLGPNLNPQYCVGGAIGTAILPLGVENHYPPGH